MGLRGVVAALALAGCGAPPAAPADADGCWIGRRTLLVTHDPLTYDGVAEVRIEGAEPGEVVTLWWSPVEEPGCTCPDPEGPCFELEAPTLLGSIEADAGGRGALELALPPDEAVGTRWIQATTADALSARTPAKVSAHLGSHYTDLEAHFVLRGDGIGRYLVPVGDVDGDGRVELAATAPAAGAVHLFDVTGTVRTDGPPARLEDLPGRITLTGPLGPDARVTAVGDIDLDGFHDLVVSSPSTGVVWLVRGGMPPGAHRLDDVAARRLFGPGLGRDLAGVDTDGDGRRDLVVGAPTRLLVSKGADLTIDQRIDGLLDPRFTAVGDLDADQRADLVVTSADGVHLLFGPTVMELLDPTPGLLVGAAGDLNGDDFRDVVLSDPDWDGGRGRVAVVYGPVWPLTTALEGEAEGERLGLAAAGAGDLDGDGMGELVVARSDGSVVLLFGPAQAYARSGDADVRFVPAEPGWRFVALAGPDVDVDGDGVHDLVMGTVSPDGATGGVHVFRGAPGW